MDRKRHFVYNRGLSVDLYPKGNKNAKAPHILYSEESTSSTSTIYNAAPYFANAKRKYEKTGEQNYMPVTALPKGIEITRLSKNLLTYTLPSKNGFLIKGVMLYLDNDAKDDPFLAQAKFIVPKEQSALLDYLMKWYIHRYNIKKR